MRKRIPLPWAHTVEESNRERNTTVYWHLSRAWNGRETRSGYNVGDALQDLNTVLESTPPNVPLHRLAFGIREDLIIHGTKKSKLRELGVANSNTCAKTFVI